VVQNLYLDDTGGKNQILGYLHIIS
jgi:hypothetical protein